MVIKFCPINFAFLFIIVFLASCSSFNPAKSDHSLQIQEYSSLSLTEISLEGVFHFKIDPDNTGILKSFHTPSYSDITWKEIKAPGSWESQGINDLKTMYEDDPDPYSGYAWYRKWIVIPAQWEGKDIEINLGQVDDTYICFWNGEKIGEKKKPTQDNIIPIPQNLIQFNSPNLLAIQVLDKWGEGGIVSGPLILKPHFPWENLELTINAKKRDFVYDIYTPILLDLNFRNPFDAPLEILLKIIIRDFDDLVVYNEQMNLGLNDGLPTNLTMDIPLLQPGYYRCQIEVCKNNIKLKTFQTSFAIIGVPIVFEDKEKSPFGICSCDTLSLERESYETLENRLLHLQKITGAIWTRIAFLWDEIEPGIGEWNFSMADRIIESYKVFDISPIVNLSGSPGLIKDGNPETDENIRAFAEYAQILASRYRDRANAWEIWYEPNDPDSWGSQPDAKSYLRLLKAAYQAIKQSNPDAKVIGMAARKTDLKFIDKTLELGAGNYMDILSIHSNPHGSPMVRNGNSDLEIIREIHTIMQKHGCKKPIWITECGWQSLGSVSEKNQAEFLVKFYVTILAEKLVERIFWFNLVDGWGSRFSRKGYFGLFHEDYTPKPSLSAFYTMVQMLKDYTEIKCLDLPEGIYGFEVISAKPQKVRVLWTELEPQLIEIQPGSTVVDLVGKSFKQTEGKILIDKTPRYVVGEWE